MAETCIDNASLLSTIVASSLLIISEVLPYFSSVKGNGITQVIAGILKTFVRKEEQQVSMV